MLAIPGANDDDWREQRIKRPGRVDSMPRRDLKSWANDYLESPERDIFIEMYDFAWDTPGIDIWPGQATTGPSFGTRVRGPSCVASPWNIGWHGVGGADYEIELEVRVASITKAGFGTSDVEFVKRELERAGFHISTDRDRYPLAAINAQIRQAIKDTTDFLIFQSTHNAR